MPEKRRPKGSEINILSSFCLPASLSLPRLLSNPSLWGSWVTEAEQDERTASVWFWRSSDRRTGWGDQHGLRGLGRSPQLPSETPEASCPRRKGQKPRQNIPRSDWIKRICLSYRRRSEETQSSLMEGKYLLQSFQIFIHIFPSFSKNVLSTSGKFTQIQEKKGVYRPEIFRH